MEHAQFIGSSPQQLQQLQQLISNDVKSQVAELKKKFQPKEPTKYITRHVVAEMLSVDLSTVHNLTVKATLQKYQIGGRVLYKRAEVENAIVKLK